MAKHINNNGFILSEYIKVFPCAYRDHFNVEARLNSELNYINGSARGLNDSYIISNSNSTFEVILKGYYFKFILDSEDSEYEYIGIKLVEKSIDSTLNNALNTSQFLANLVSDANPVELDDEADECFKGAKFYKTDPTNAGLDTYINFRAAAETATGSATFPLKYNKIESKKPGYAIIGDFYKKDNKIEQVGNSQINIKGSTIIGTTGQQLSALTIYGNLLASGLTSLSGKTIIGLHSGEEVIINDGSITADNQIKLGNKTAGTDGYLEIYNNKNNSTEKVVAIKATNSSGDYDIFNIDSKGKIFTKGGILSHGDILSQGDINAEQNTISANVLNTSTINIEALLSMSNASSSVEIDLQGELADFSIENIKLAENLEINSNKTIVKNKPLEVQTSAIIGPNANLPTNVLTVNGSATISKNLTVNGDNIYLGSGRDDTKIYLNARTDNVIFTQGLGNENTPIYINSNGKFAECKQLPYFLYSSRIINETYGRSTSTIDNGSDMTVVAYSDAGDKADGNILIIDNICIYSGVVKSVTGCNGYRIKPPTAAYTAWNLADNSSNITCINGVATHTADPATNKAYEPTKPLVTTFKNNYFYVFAPSPGSVSFTCTFYKNN